jgi:hypothetical protein
MLRRKGALPSMMVKLLFTKTTWLPSNHNDLIESGTGSQQRRIGSKCYPNSRTTRKKSLKSGDFSLFICIFANFVVNLHANLDKHYGRNE